MAIDFKALLAKLEDGSVPESSTFDLFNEDKQKRDSGVGIKKLSYEFKQKVKVLFPLMLAVPFNPKTGKADEQFNATNKWRTPYAASDSALVLKAYSNMNASAKEAFMRRVGATEWDTSDLTQINKKDKEIFRQYRVPTVSTAYVLSVNEPQISGNKYSVNYYIDATYDATIGEFTTKLPQLAKFGEIYRDMLFAEISDLKAAHKQKDASLYLGERPFINRTAIPSFSEKDMKDTMAKLWETVPIGTVRPLNYLFGFAFNLNPKTATMLTDDKQQGEEFSPDPLKINEHRFYVNYSKKFENYIMTTIQEVVNDVYFDFIEADMIDQQTVAPQDDITKMLAARNLTPSRSSSSIWDIDDEKFRYSWCEEFMNGVRQAITDNTDFEQKVRRLVAKTTSKLTDDVTEAARGVMKSALLLKNVYMRDSICLHHRDTLFYIYGQAYNTEISRRGLLDLDENEETNKIAAPEGAIEAKKEVEEIQTEMDLEMETVDLE